MIVVHHNRVGAKFYCKGRCCEMEFVFQLLSAMFMFITGVVVSATEKSTANIAGNATIIGHVG